MKARRTKKANSKAKNNANPSKDANLQPLDPNILNHLQAKYLNLVTRSLSTSDKPDNSHIEPSYAPDSEYLQTHRNDKINLIAMDLVLQYLQNKNMTLAIDTAYSESCNSIRRNFEDRWLARQLQVRGRQNVLHGLVKAKKDNQFDVGFGEDFQKRQKVNFANKTKKSLDSFDTSSTIYNYQEIYHRDKNHNESNYSNAKNVQTQNDTYSKAASSVKSQNESMKSKTTSSIKSKNDSSTRSTNPTSKKEVHMFPSASSSQKKLTSQNKITDNSNILPSPLKTSSTIHADNNNNTTPITPDLKTHTYDYSTIHSGSSDEEEPTHETLYEYETLHETDKSNAKAYDYEYVTEYTSHNPELSVSEESFEKAEKPKNKTQSSHNVKEYEEEVYEYTYTTNYSHQYSNISDNKRQAQPRQIQVNNPIPTQPLSPIQIQNEINKLEMQRAQISQLRAQNTINQMQYQNQPGKPTNPSNQLQHQPNQIQSQNQPIQIPQQEPPKRSPYMSAIARSKIKLRLSYLFEFEATEPVFSTFHTVDVEPNPELQRKFKQATLSHPQIEQDTLLNKMSESVNKLRDDLDNPQLPLSPIHTRNAESKPKPSLNDSEDLSIYDQLSNVDVFPAQPRFIKRDPPKDVQTRDVELSGESDFTLSTDTSMTHEESQHEMKPLYSPRKLQQNQSQPVQPFSPKVIKQINDYLSDSTLSTESDARPFYDTKPATKNIYADNELSTNEMSFSELFDRIDNKMIYDDKPQSRQRSSVCSDRSSVSSSRSRSRHHKRNQQPVQEDLSISINVVECKLPKKIRSRVLVSLKNFADKETATTIIHEASSNPYFNTQFIIPCNNLNNDQIDINLYGYDNKDNTIFQSLLSIPTRSFRLNEEIDTWFNFPNNDCKIHLQIIACIQIEAQRNSTLSNNTIDNSQYDISSLLADSISHLSIPTSFKDASQSEQRDNKTKSKTTFSTQLEQSMKEKKKARSRKSSSHRSSSRNSYASTDALVLSAGISSDTNNQLCDTMSANELLKLSEASTLSSFE